MFPPVLQASCLECCTNALPCSCAKLLRRHCRAPGLRRFESSLACDPLDSSLHTRQCSAHVICLAQIPCALFCALAWVAKELLFFLLQSQERARFDGNQLRLAQNLRQVPLFTVDQASLLTSVSADSPHQRWWKAPAGVADAGRSISGQQRRLHIPWAALP